MRAVLPRCHGDLLACEQLRAPYLCYTAFVACVLPQLAPVRNTGRNPYDMRVTCKCPPLCYDFSRETTFLGDPEVQRALGVNHVRSWQSCNTSLVLPFVLSGDWLNRFDYQVAKLLVAGVRVLVYNGDTDYVVDWIGSKQWVMELDWAHKEEWAAARDVPFVSEGRVRGLERTAGGLTFMQMYESGHLVPRDQPEASLAMLRELLAPGSRWAAAASAQPAGQLGAADPMRLVLPQVALAALAALLLAPALVLARRSLWQSGRLATGDGGCSSPLLAA